MDNQTLVLIGLGVLLVVSLVIAYLASKTWSAPQVVLVYTIFLATCFFVYLAAKTLKIQQTYRQQASQFQQRFQQLDQDNGQLEFGVEAVGGGAGKPGIFQLRHELDKLTLVRGGVWRNCQLTKADQGGTVVIKIAKSVPVTMEKNTILFAFEQGDGKRGAGAHFLGALKVVEIDAQGRMVTLTPATIPTHAELERITGSKRPWSLYEVMPVDRPEVFAGLDEKQLEALIPPASLGEYLRDGKKAKEDDPPSRVMGVLKDGRSVPLAILEQQGKLDQVVEKRYRRPLRDYVFLIREFGKQRAVNQDTLAQLLRDQQQLKQSLAQAKKDVAYRESEKQQLTEDLKGFTFERDVVTAYLADVDALRANVTSKLAAVTAKNDQLATQLAQLQDAAARRIDQPVGAGAEPSATR